ncbi:uncharacterized protein [Macrobrachium rosenbergii]|uniref:uncharacterized protein n=1 Tax=Macrobrachium rosenbergii TaxID=79674 RepID=UPI0034D3999D
MAADSSLSNPHFERNPVPPERRANDDCVNEIRPLWTALMEEMLIYYIRANRLLWDPNHPHFTKPMLKRRKVEDIAAIIKRESGFEDDFVLSPEDVWRKFRNLRTFFVREVRKVNERRRQPSEEPYESKWVHFNRMLFLVDSLKKSIQANVPLPGEGANPASVKIEGSRARAPVGSLSGLNELQQQYQETEDELRIGGEWSASSSTDNRTTVESSAARSSMSVGIDRGCDNVISRSSSRMGTYAAKRAKLSMNQEKKVAEVTEAFGKFVTASVRRCPEEKQQSLMAHITQCIAEFSNKK